MREGGGRKGRKEGRKEDKAEKKGRKQKCRRKEMLGICNINVCSTVCVCVVCVRGGVT